MRLAMAMQGIAAHAVREWQLRIEQGLPLDLAPEQIALLTKCSAELERSAIGEDREHQATEICIYIGSHAYPGERNVEDEPKLVQDFEAEQYEKLSDDEKAVLGRWRDPPRKKLN